MSERYLGHADIDFKSPFSKPDVEVQNSYVPTPTVTEIKNPLSTAQEAKIEKSIAQRSIVTEIKNPLIGEYVPNSSNSLKNKQFESSYANNNLENTEYKVRAFKPILAKHQLLGNVNVYGLAVLADDETDLQSAISNSWKNVENEFAKGRRTDINIKEEDLLEVLAPQLIDLKEKNERGNTVETSNHEMGHAYVAKRMGWGVATINVIPQGNTLGYTEVVPPSKSDSNVMFGMIVICYGGKAAESVCGISDHRGCGSDMAKANYLANVLSSKWGVKPGSILGSAESVAYSTVSASSSNIRKDAGHLAQKKVIA